MTKRTRNLAQHLEPIPRPAWSHYAFPEGHRKAAARLADRVGTRVAAYIYSVNRGTISRWQHEHASGADTQSA